jgi:hypothetical protein
VTNKDWRIETDGLDYFRGQKKTLEVADRRPVIRKASDLVGPGIDSNTIRITDFNDVLATFNGYYSSDPGAEAAPNTTEAFVGHVVSDAEFGGRQVFTGMTSGVVYSRTFHRSPTDPETMGWTEWSGQRIPAAATGFNRVASLSQPEVLSRLVPPTLITVGEAGVYERSDGGIRLRKQGVYTGYIQVGDYLGTTVGDLYPMVPSGASMEYLGQLGVNLKPTVHIPFTVIATTPDLGFSVSFVLDAALSPRDLWWRFGCTRVGDAI